MLCDEIASLGPMDAFLMASTLMRGWGLTLWSFWQNPSQLENAFFRSGDDGGDFPSLPHGER